MEDGTNTERRWIEPAELLRIVERDSVIKGEESFEEVISREPYLLIPVSPAENPPLDLHTYRVRRDRWEAGQGPRLSGMSEFVRTLEALVEPACSASVTGASTTYMFLLDASWSRVLAGVAIDPPRQ